MNLPFAVWLALLGVWHIEARSAAAQKQYDAGDFAACADSYESLSQAPGWSFPQLAASSAADCAARAGQTDRAFRLLDKALALYRTLGATHAVAMSTDPDLDTLHGDSRWPAFTKAVAAYDRSMEPNDGVVAKLLDSDQAARAGALRPTPEGDAARRKQLDARLQQVGTLGVRELYAAAMLMQHGTTVEDAARAMDYARRALALEPNTCAYRQLTALTEDRWLMRQGKPQRFGTQYHCPPPDGGPPHCRRLPVDASVTDAERVARCVAPLAEQAVELNE